MPSPSNHFFPATNAPHAAPTDRPHAGHFIVAEAAAGLTGGRLVLCQSRAELPDAFPCAEGSAGQTLRLSPRRGAECLRAFRADAERVARRAGFGGDQLPDFMVAVGEAALNALLYGRDATGCFCHDSHTDRVQAWISDRGPGISPRTLLHALRGPVMRDTSPSASVPLSSGAPGLWIMTRLADCVYLSTGPSGTTVVIEIDGRDGNRTR